MIPEPQEQPNVNEDAENQVAEWRSVRPGLDERQVQ